MLTWFSVIVKLFSSILLIVALLPKLILFPVTVKSPVTSTFFPVKLIEVSPCIGAASPWAGVLPDFILLPFTVKIPSTSTFLSCSVIALSFWELIILPDTFNSPVTSTFWP